MRSRRAILASAEARSKICRRELRVSERNVKFTSVATNLLYKGVAYVREQPVSNVTEKRWKRTNSPM